jgi:sterol desaturase/sphingolipid hydroxylase (fatty acid hydroxylase superfamily)
MRLGTFGYYADFLGSLTCSLILFVLAMSQSTWLLRVEWSVSFLIGVAAWTLLEYGIHRWIYHGVEPFIRLHGSHHKEPDAYIGSPPLIGIALIILATCLPGMFLGMKVATGLTAGVLVGYMLYQLIHHATHFWQPSHGSYLYRARLRHAGHHYHRELGNFGITTAFWDQLFGTVIAARRISPRGDEDEEEEDRRANSTTKKSWRCHRA